MSYFAVFEIKPGETLTRPIDFAGKLRTGVGFAESGHTTEAVNFYSRRVDNTVLVSTTPEISGTDVLLAVTGVELDERYEATITLTLDDATPSVIKETILIIGVEKYSS